MGSSASQTFNGAQNFTKTLYHSTPHLLIPHQLQCASPPHTHFAQNHTGAFVLGFSLISGRVEKIGERDKRIKP